MQRRPYMVKTKCSKQGFYEKRAKGAIDEIERHMSMIFAICLLDKLEWGPKKISNCEEKIYALKQKVLTGEWTMHMIDNYLDKKKIDMDSKIKEIPLRQKLFICGSYKRGATANIVDFANMTLHDIYAFMIPPLKEEYRLSNEKIYYLMDEMAKYIDSYARGYVDDAGIVEAFKITTKYDINTGKKITEEEWKTIQ